MIIIASVIKVIRQITINYFLLFSIVILLILHICLSDKKDHYLLIASLITFRHFIEHHFIIKFNFLVMSFIEPAILRHIRLNFQLFGFNGLMIITLSTFLRLSNHQFP